MTDIALTNLVTLTNASGTGGVTFIPQPTQLTRLNYFDGKFLRADDLRVEQDYLRSLTELSNQAGGSGVVQGMSLTLGSGDGVSIAAGFAIDPAGRVLLLPQAVSLSIDDLVSGSRSRLADGSSAPASASSFGDCVPASAPDTPAVQGSRFWLICAQHAEALCGEEDVYGLLCEEACVTSTDRPYWLEGIVVRALPLTPGTPFATSKAVALSAAHQRSLLASAYFAEEFAAGGSLLSADGLRSEAWCLGASPAVLASCVPLGVIGRAGSVTLFLDAWTVRRERIEPPNRSYWAGLMAMRPWGVFLAQVLQFQCQLHEVLTGGGDAGAPPGPCRDQEGALTEALSLLGELASTAPEPSAGAPALDYTRISDVTFVVQGALQKLQAGIGDRILIDGGIVELPPAGYLPVTPGATPTVNEQVRSLLGNGLDLRFCVVRHDYIGEAFQQGQQMDRISLLQGLDNPDDKPAVDVFVPDGAIAAGGQATAGSGFDAMVWLSPQFDGEGAVQELAWGSSMPSRAASSMSGAARFQRAPGGGPQLFIAAASEISDPAQAGKLVRALGTLGAAGRQATGLKLLEQVKPEAAIDAATVDPAAAESLLGQVEVDGAASAVLSSWISLSCDRDPFSSTDAEPIPVSGTGMLSVPSQGDTLTEAEFRGDFRIISAQTQVGGTRRASGLLEGLVWRTTVSAGRAVNTGSAQGSYEVTLTDAPLADGGRELILTLALGGGVITTRGAWGSTPAALTKTSITYQATDSQGAAPVVLATAQLTSDPDYAQPAANPYRLANAALLLLSRDLQDPSFLSDSERALFPPAPVAGSTLEVQATLPWVLFRRRRSCNCGEDTTPVVQATSAYTVYGEVVAGDSGDPVIVAGNAASADAAARKLVSLGTITFTAGAATVVSGSQQVLGRWQTLAAGDELLGALIVVNDPAADQALATQRLDAVQQLVSPVTPAGSSLSAQVTTGPSTVLTAVPGTDGAIGLAAGKKPTETMLMEVYFAAAASEQAVDADIKAGNGDGALGRAGQLDDLGPVTFALGADQAAQPPTAVIAKYHALPAAQQQAGGWNRGWVFYTDQEQADVALLTKRAKYIGSQLNQSKATIECAQVTQALPLGRSSIVVFAMPT